MLKNTAIVLALVVLLAGSVGAAITGTYIDANLTNTVGIDGSGDPLPEADWYSATRASDDNRWSLRVTEPSQGTDLFVSSGQTPEDAPVIRTTITGLDPTHEYKIRVVFNGNPGAFWGVKAGLEGGTQTVYEYDNATMTGFDDGVIHQMEAVLGTVSGVSSANILVDDHGDSGWDHRSRYDGVSYEDLGVIPEPATMGLLGVGGLSLLARRRRRV